MLVTLHSSDAIYRQPSDTLNSANPLQGNTIASSGGSAMDQALNTLAEKIPGLSGSEFKQLDANQFTPEKVSNRIADFVAQGLQQARQDGKSEAEVQRLYEQALGGIEQGFNEARTILEEMNLLTDALAETIDTSFDLTLQALDKLAPGAAAQPVAGTSLAAAERFQQAESFSLKLRTQDGDKVMIKFASASSYEASFGGYVDGEGGSAVAFNIDRSERSNFSFSVKGELDDDEIDAIQNLIKDVSLIADDFFDGDVQAAFEQATEFKMDKSELASMHLTLSRSQQHSAVAAYQQVQDPDAQHSPNRKLGHMMQDLTDRFNQPALGFIDSPLDFGQQLLSNLIDQDQRYRDADEQQQSLYDQHREDMQALLSEDSSITPRS